MVPFLPWILKFDLFLAYMDFDFWNLSQSVVNLEIPLWWCVVLSSMGIGREGKMVSCSMDFEIWYFVVNFSAEKYFSLSFRVGKMKFHHFCPPGKILFVTFWKNHYCPHGKNPSDVNGYHDCSCVVLIWYVHDSSKSRLLQAPRAC